MAIEALALSVEAAHDFEEALGGTGDAAPLVTREEWDRLLAGSASDGVFLTWQWQSVWWKHFGAQDDCTLHLLALRDARGALVAIAPLFIASEQLPPPREYQPGKERPVGEGRPLRLVRLVGGTEAADYLDIIASPDKLVPAWAAVLDYLLERKEDWDAIDLHFLPESSPSREVLPRLAAERGMSAQVLPEDVAPVLALPQEGGTYLMSL